MSAASPSRSRPPACPRCAGVVDVKSPHVVVRGGAIRMYCSDACMRAPDAPAPTLTPAPAPPPRRRRWRWVALAAAASTTCIVLSRSGDESTREPVLEVATARAATAPRVAPTPAPAPPPPDPAAEARRAEEEMIERLMREAWIHPLAGPNRRMPRNHTGAFGAARDRDPPPECLSGHCGVDVGRVWGEPIHAIHAGVVDWVNRGPNEERGGAFVKLSHRDGTIYSWYFHLAAIPKWVRPGAKVSAGDVIGLLGDTGIKHSAPHLHFAITVKPSKTARERYIDPEPLLAIWPLWVPDADREGGRLATAAEPGLPVRVPPPRKKRAKKRRAAPAVEGPVAAEVTSSSPDPAPAPDPVPGFAPAPAP